MNRVAMCTRVETVADAAALFSMFLPDVQKEERVFVLPLDANGVVLAKPILIAVGHVNGMTAIDAGAVFRAALKVGAEEIIVAHNHPSGRLRPSMADLRMTKELKSRAEWLGLRLLDHLILGAPSTGGNIDFMSLAETGEL